MMNENYQTVSLVMRFVFCLLGTGILAYSVLALIRDAKNARLMRNDEAETGYIAQLIPEGRGERINLLREGEIGSGSTCDIVIKGRKLGRRHCYYEIENGIMYLYPLVKPEKRPAKTREEKEPEHIEVSSGETFAMADAEYRFVMLGHSYGAVSPANRKAKGE